jgi:tetratricopeptide (TPR) repeat protein
MRRPRWSVLAAVPLALGLVLVAGLAVGGAAEEQRPPAAVAPVDPTSVVGDPAGAARSLQERLRRLPGDWQSWAALGSVYVQSATLTADPTYYDKADAAFARSLQENPDGNDAAIVGQAALAASRHDFVRARDLAEQALALNAYSAPALGVLTDAHAELGDDAAAADAARRMLELRPGVPAYTRASYAFELRGDREGARIALEEALGLAVDPADAAFARRYLGELAFGEGNLDEATRQFEAGLERFPTYAPLDAGLARVAAARGDVESAVARWTDVVQRLPEPGYVTELGDLYASLGRTAEAEQQYGVVRATADLFRAAGADLDREQALFAADHGDPAAALAAAERTWTTQRSVLAADAYAWALHANGRYAEALEMARSAQRLGTHDALLDYHRGMIELALGDRSAARASLSSALATNPHFSVLHAPRARAALAELGGAL